MSAVTQPFDARERPLARLTRWPLAPSEGWSTLAIVWVMLAVLALAVDDARWAGTGPRNVSQTSFLPWAVTLSLLLGFVLAKARISPLIAHLVSAFAGGTFLLVAVSGVVSPSPSLVERLRALNASAAIFYNDLVVEGIRSSETSVFLLTVGAVAWTTAQFAAFNVFRRHQPVVPILVAGFVLLLNMSITIRTQYLHLVVFSAAALLLLVRMNLMEQRQAWVRRRIADVGSLSAPFMRSGVALLAVALVGSVLLSNAASSAPLANVWRDADDQLLRIGSELNRVVGGVTGPARGSGGLFGSSQTIRGVWLSSSDIVMRVEASDGGGYYWRGATYDTFDGTTWQQVDRGAPLRVEPGQPLLAPTTEIVEPGRGRRDVTFRMTPVDSDLHVLLAPEAPFAADRAADVYTNEPGGPFATIELAEPIAPGDAYTVSALVRVEGRREGGITGNLLARAGRDYPAWVDRYRAIRPRSIGEVTYATGARIVNSLPEDMRDPYHIAVAMQQYLYDTGDFQYQTDVRGLCETNRLVDCFLETKRGYCEHFATAMAMLLRTQSIPARLAVGYLPGRKLANGSWEVDQAAAHTWVEVYFPRYGWVRFDPTPGNRVNGQTPTRIPAGPRVPEPDPTPSASPSTSAAAVPPRDPDDDDDIGRQPVAAPPTSTTTDGAAGALVLTSGLIVVAVALALWARRRKPVPSAPDIAYRRVTTLARRLGYGPRPTQTAYEYAGSLGELLPRISGDLHVVARAKVESTYAARRPQAESLVALGEAYRRVRIGLLRLVGRRLPRRRLRGRSLRRR